jgi:putative (di)nucleoside polyphosphate hydrolase
VRVLGSTPGWLRYRLPRRYRRHHQKPMCIGQKQVWFLLHFLAGDDAFRLDSVESPEFDEFRWVDFWYPARNVIPFKRRVYIRALKHLEPKLPVHAEASVD